MAQYTTTIEIYAKSLTSEYTLEPHLYRRIENKIENTRKVEDVLWEAIEIEGLDNKKLYVEITIEDDTGYVDSESFFIKSRVVRTETPSHYIVWGTAKPHIFSIDRGRSFMEVEH